MQPTRHGSVMNRVLAHAILDLVRFPDYRFDVHGSFDGQSPTYLQASFMAPCNVAGGAPERQTTRKWLLSCWMTPSELVQTAFKCVLTAIEHEAREQFTYRGAAIFGPHFDVDALVQTVDMQDARAPL